MTDSSGLSSDISGRIYIKSGLMGDRVLTYSHDGSFISSINLERFQLFNKRESAHLQFCDIHITDSMFVMLDTNGYLYGFTLTGEIAFRYKGLPSYEFTYIDNENSIIIFCESGEVLRLKRI